MAASDVSLKLSTLNLGKDNNETERPKHFWNQALVAMKFSFEPIWLDAAWKAGQKPNFGMRNLEAVLEERCSLELEITRPLINSYLKEIGRAFWAIEAYWSNASNKASKLATSKSLYLSFIVYILILQCTVEPL